MKIKRKGNKVWLLSDSSYVKANKKVMRVEDNGNGFTVKSYGWDAPYPDLYWSLGYADAADLMECLKEFDFR